MNTKLLLNTIESLLTDGTEVITATVQKGNETLTGFSIGNGNIKPTVYMEHYEKVFEQGGYMAVAKEMIKLCSEVEIPNINSDVITLEFVKNNLQLCIAPKGTNNRFVAIPYLDLELYFRVRVFEDVSYKIKKEMLELWNITEEELLDVALQTNEYNASSMKEIMIEMMVSYGATEEEIEEVRNNGIDQTVVTNETKMFGASAIYKKSILKEVADKYESDLYIIPSSIHEVLLIPTKCGDKEEMDSMVREVNETQVEPHEVLADHVYIFRRETMKIEW